MPFHAIWAAVVTPVRGWSNFDAAIHAGVVIACIVVAGIVVGIRGHLDPELGNIMLAAVGFAAGRSGVSGRIRQEDLASDLERRGRD